MQGFPKQTCGSMEIRDRSACLSIASESNRGAPGDMSLLLSYPEVPESITSIASSEHKRAAGGNRRHLWPRLWIFSSRRGRPGSGWEESHSGWGTFPSRCEASDADGVDPHFVRGASLRNERVPERDGGVPRRSGRVAHLAGCDPDPGGKEAHRARSIPFQMGITPSESRDAAIQLQEARLSPLARLRPWTFNPISTGSATVDR